MNRNHMHILKDINMWTKYSQTVLRLLRNANMRLPVWANDTQVTVKACGPLVLDYDYVWHNVNFAFLYRKIWEWFVQ